MAVYFCRQIKGYIYDIQREALKRQKEMYYMEKELRKSHQTKTGEVPKPEKEEISEND